MTEPRMRNARAAGYDLAVMKSETPTAAHRTPSAAQVRTFAVLSLAYLAITLVATQWASDPGPMDARIVVVYSIAILAADLCTALLLGAMYAGSGRSALLVLACAYLYSGCMAAVHMAAFPGALASPPLIDGPLAEAVLYLAWRFGTAALFLVAVLQAARQAIVADRLPRRMVAALGLTVAAGAVLASLAAHLPLEAWLRTDFPAVASATEWAAIVLCVAGFAVILHRRAFGDVLYLWLGLVLVATAGDLVLSNMAGAPFTMGWHAARASFVVSA